MLADSTATIYLIKQKDSIKLALPEKIVHFKILGSFGIYGNQFDVKVLANFSQVSIPFHPELEMTKIEFIVLTKLLKKKLQRFSSVPYIL